MLVYRVFHHDPAAKPGAPGSAEYLHRPQGSGRWDNPHLYDAWYLARTPEGAIGESFGNLAGAWSASMFATGKPGVSRALATFSVPDDVRVFDFDDPSNLTRIAMRPSEVVIRNKPATQRRAEQLFAERLPDGTATWQGVQWWSYHHARWSNFMLWSTPAAPAPITLVQVDALHMSLPAVIDAAGVLNHVIA